MLVGLARWGRAHSEAVDRVPHAQDLAVELLLQHAQVISARRYDVQLILRPSRKMRFTFDEDDGGVVELAGVLGIVLGLRLARMLLHERLARLTRLELYK